jgi:hypothetical protein
MAWVMSDPLVTTNTPEQNERDRRLWESEDLGGITEDNNRLPVPVVWLLVLTVLTAFAITFPLWGQRPTPAIYQPYLDALNSPTVQAITDDDAAMKQIKEMAKEAIAQNGYQPLLDRHPVTIDDLRALDPQIKAVVANGIPGCGASTSNPGFTWKGQDNLKNYTVVGHEVVCANFEGTSNRDGSVNRFQPWWDNGYTVDIFYLLAFFLGVVAVVKRLPPSSWQPTHGHDH